MARPPSTLVEAFTSSLQAFDYVDFARGFEDDYQSSLMALQMARLRLSRWGTVMNIYRDPQYLHGNLHGAAADARSELQHFLNHFSDAENRSKQYDPRPSFIKPGERLSTAEQSVVNKVHEICMRRQEDSSPVGRHNLWALREKRDFVGLMSKVLSSLDRLDALCPAASTHWRLRLAMLDSQQLSLEGLSATSEMMKTVEAVDPQLAAAYRVNRQGHSYRNLHIEASNVANGDWVAESYMGSFEVQNNVYDGVLIQKNSRVVNGNCYGGNSFFS